MKETKKHDLAKIMLVFFLCFFTLFTGINVSANNGVKYLSDMEGSANEHTLYVINNETEFGQKISIGGEEYEKGIIVHPGYDGPSEVTYNIEGLGYSQFRSIGGKDKSAGSAVGGDPGIEGTAVQMQVYVDGVLKADSGRLPYPETYEFAVDIVGAKNLKLVVKDGGDTIYCDATAWADAKLINNSVSSISVVNKPRIGYGKGELLDCTGATIKVKYADGYENVLPLEESMVSGFESSETGWKKLTVTYGGKTTKLDVLVGDALDLTGVSPLSWKVYGGSFADESPTYSIGINTAFNSTEKICIADVVYSKGLGVHPAGDESSYITFDIENSGYNYISVVAGKDLTSAADVGIDAVRKNYAISFDILVDNELVESSKVMYYGEAHHFFVDITDAKTVTLRANDVDGITCDASSWCAPILLSGMPLGESTEEDTNPPTGDITIYMVLLIIISSSLIVIKKHKYILG